MSRGEVSANVGTKQIWVGHRVAQRSKLSHLEWTSGSVRAKIAHLRVPGEDQTICGKAVKHRAIASIETHNQCRSCLARLAQRSDVRRPKSGPEKYEVTIRPNGAWLVERVDRFLDRSGRVKIARGTAADMELAERFARQAVEKDKQNLKDKDDFEARTKRFTIDA